MPNLTRITSDKFISEVWVNEIRAYLRAKLVLGAITRSIDFVGKKGDTLHIPDLSELVANDKTANTEVTLQAPTETEFTMTINKHKETSFLVEDILEAQSQYNLRSEYTKAAGYAIAKQLDSDLFSLYANLSQKIIGGDGKTVWNPAVGGNGTDLTDEGIRRMLQNLDDADAPEENRAIVIPPCQKNVLLGIKRFTEQAFYGSGNAIKTAEFGEIYGTKVYTTTRCPVVLSANSTKYRVGLLLHKDSLVSAIQKNVRTQAEYALLKLGWAVVTDILYDVAKFRDDHAIAFFVPV